MTDGFRCRYSLSEYGRNQFVVRRQRGAQFQPAEVSLGLGHSLVDRNDPIRVLIHIRVHLSDKMLGSVTQPITTGSPGLNVQMCDIWFGRAANDVNGSGAIGCEGGPPQFFGVHECGRVIGTVAKRGDDMWPQSGVQCVVAPSGTHGRTLVVRRCVMADVEVSSPRPGVAEVLLNRPDKLNAMTSSMVEQLHGAFRSISEDRTTRVVVLTGAGRGFCAGLDLNGYGEAPGFEWHGRVERGFAVQKHIASLIPAMRRMPQPIISAVNGPAAGGGFALVLGSDIRIASATARFNAAFIRIGLSACDIGTSWLLPRLVGAARAHELMLTGRIFDATEAERIGLVSQVYPDDALLDAAYAKADEVMLNSPIGVALTKEGMWSALEIPGMQAAIDLENRQQIMASFSTDAAETRAARAERRQPNYDA